MKLYRLFLCALALAALSTASASAEDSPVLVSRYKELCSGFYKAAVGNGDLARVASRKIVARVKTEASGTDTYANIRALGDADSLAISDIVHLARGDLFVCRTSHAKGQVDWSLGYSPTSHLIEEFKVALVPPPPAPAAAPAPTPAAAPAPAPAQPAAAPQNAASETAKPPAPNKSQACQMFPDLC